jgi:hypothetical protein
MQVLLNSSALHVAQQYIYNHIINTSGWFSGSDYTVPHFIFNFSENSKKIIEQNSEIEYSFNLDKDSFNFLLNRLACRDTQMPDDEPDPLLSPSVDLMIYRYQQKMMDFCIRHKIPFISKMPWPGGLPFAVVITHDVDITRKYGLRSLVRDLSTAKFVDFADHFRQSVFKNNIYWNFNELLDFYKEWEIRSSFFFIARAMENLNYRYRIGSDKFRRLFERLIQDQHEIGLHSSRYAFDHPGRIKSEKEKLERVAGLEAKGVRQHYLRLTFPQAWRNFQNQGFKYDSSGGYNEGMGYRAGTSFPFITYDIEKEEILKIYEIPFNIMDYPWEEMKLTSSSVADLFSDFTKQIESTNGLLHILWHPHNLAEPTFKPLWSRIFKWLGSKEYYNESLTNILDWRERRAEVNLNRLKVKNDSFDFELVTVNTVHDLFLQIISPSPLQTSDSLTQCKPEDQLKYLLKLPPLKPGKHSFSLPFLN